MDHAEIESLLGAYALDAVSPEEAAEIEAHLQTCPRCAVEVAVYREVAALLGGGGADAPAGVWDKIAAELGDGQQVADLDAARLMREIRSGRSSSRPRVLIPIGFVAAVIAVLFAIESTQLSHLNNEVHQYQAIAQRGGIAPAVAAVLSGEHRTITLDCVSSGYVAKIAVAPDGQAYWVSSSLEALGSGKTYQLWALSQGRVVSIGLLGANPHLYSAFRIQPSMSQVMVTIEPSGGHLCANNSSPSPGRCTGLIRAPRVLARLWR